MSKLELYRDVMEMIDRGKSIIEVVKSMKGWRVDSISSNRCTISKWIKDDHICISIYIGSCIKNVHVF